MPICITCSTPVKNLYTTYSKADDRSLGKGVRLTQCPNCKRFADKYVEHDYVVLFIDLVLIKPQVYRHLLFNRLNTPPDTFDPSILRLGILLILFDVYITWARIERVNSSGPLGASSSQPSGSQQHSGGDFSSAPIIIQYLFFLTLNVVATAVQHGVICILARRLVRIGREWSITARSGDAVRDGLVGGGDASNSHEITRPVIDQQQQRQQSGFNDSPSKLQDQRGQSDFLSETKATMKSNTTSRHEQGQVTTTGTSTSLKTQDEIVSTPLPSSSLSKSTNKAVQQNKNKTSPPLPNNNNNNKRRNQSAAADRQKAMTASGNSTNKSNSQTAHPGAQASPSAISTALLVSSCTKLFPILLVIWPTAVTGQTVDDGESIAADAAIQQPSRSSSSLAPFAYRATSHIGWVVLVNNIEALLILLDCGYVVATVLAVAGLLSRWVVEGMLLSSVGLVREMEGPVGDVLDILGWLVGMVR